MTNVINLDRRKAAKAAGKSTRKAKQSPRIDQFAFDACIDDLVVSVPFPDECVDMSTLCTWQRTFPAASHAILHMGPTYDTYEPVKLFVQIHRYDLRNRRIIIGVNDIWCGGDEMNTKEFLEFVNYYPEQAVELRPVWECTTGTKEKFKVVSHSIK